jgi:26S proteasome regulatory subunit N2
MALTSANGILSLLEEDDVQLKVYALEKLNSIVDEFWAEIAGSVSQMCVFSS